MKYETSPKVYSCCGQYLATVKATKDSKVYCPRCGQLMKAPLQVPKIVVVKTS